MHAHGVDKVGRAAARDSGGGDGGTRDNALDSGVAMAVIPAAMVMVSVTSAAVVVAVVAAGSCGGSWGTGGVTGVHGLAARRGGDGAKRIAGRKTGLRPRRPTPTR